MIVGKYSMGIGDRFGQQGKAQLAAFMKAKEMGIEVTPVWNKSFREHSIIHTDPADTRAEAEAATKALGWDAPYFVDADHVSLKIIVLLIGICAVYLVVTGSAMADFTFGTPINLGAPINTSYDDQPVGITADGLSLYLASKRPGGESEWVDIWMATRPTKDDPWGEPVNLGPPVNTPRSEEETDISADGLTLYIRRAEGSDLTPRGVPNWDIWVSTRATTDDLWGVPVNLGPPINTPVEDMDPSISTDGLTMYFSSRGAQVCSFV